MAPVALRGEVAPIVLADPGHVLFHRDAAEPVGAEIVRLLRVVREQAERAVAPQEVVQERRRIREVARIVRQPERSVRLIGVLPAILQNVGGGLGPEPDPASLVSGHVHDEAALAGNPLHRRFELRPAVAALRPEHVSGQAVRVHPHQGMRLPGRVAEDEHAVHRHVGHDAGEAADRPPLPQRPGKLVHGLELGMAHDREPVGDEVGAAHVQGERNRPEKVEGAASGGNRGVEVETPPAPVDTKELALGGEPGADGGVDIGEHRAVASAGRVERRTSGPRPVRHLGARYHGVRPLPLAPAPGPAFRRSGREAAGRVIALRLQDSCLVSRAIWSGFAAASSGPRRMVAGSLLLPPIRLGSSARRIRRATPMQPEDLGRARP